MEKRILQLIPRCAVEGIPGGIESPVPDFREESNCTFGSGTQAEEIEVDMCLGMAVDAFENDSQTALTPNSEAQSCLPEPASASNNQATPSHRATCGNIRKRLSQSVQDKGDDYMKTLSGYEDRKGQLLEGILCELKSLREIQQERLNLEREKFQFMQTMDSNSLLSSIIKF
ncbi:uncharacterized protein [Haliotis cracherodii]